METIPGNSARRDTTVGQTPGGMNQGTLDDHNISGTKSSSFVPRSSRYNGDTVVLFGQHGDT